MSLLVFTGAIAQRKGRFEVADRGTVLLDEIGEIAPALQVRRLLVLQELEFERVGRTRPLKIDIRLIAATNRDLEEAVGRGVFREALSSTAPDSTVGLSGCRSRRAPASITR